MKKLLIIEDDNIVSLMLKKQFEQKGYEVFQVFNGSAAIRKIINIAPDCILLDIGLPDKNGYDICLEIRSFYKGSIIFFTGNDSSSIEVNCFTLGADDFVSKMAPFDVLYQRVKRLEAKEIKVEESQDLNMCDIIFKPHLLDCEYNGENIGLTQEEYELFYFIAINHKAPVSRQMILQVLKGIDYNGFDRSVDIKVARIRAKLKNSGYERTLIHSIRSKGYQFAGEQSLAS